MTEAAEKRLAELKSTSSDPKLHQLFEEMVQLEIELDDLKQCEKYRRNPKNPAQVKINPAFYAYHKTLSAYKEIVRVIMANSNEGGETSPLREYLSKLRNGGLTR